MYTTNVIYILTRMYEPGLERLEEVIF